MLKQHSSDQLPEPPEERPVGELVQELVENGKAYAKAEMAVARATAAAKADSFKLPAVLFGLAFLLVQASVAVLGVGILLAIEPLLGPVGAGLAVFFLMAGLAGLFAWIAVNRLKGDK